jgi:hypothetical protein
MGEELELDRFGARVGNGSSFENDRDYNRLLEGCFRMVERGAPWGLKSSSVIAIRIGPGWIS